MDKVKKIKVTMMTSFLIAFILLTAFTGINLQAADNEAKTYIIPMEDWIRNEDINAIRLVNVLLEEDVPVYWALEPFMVGGSSYPAGTFYIKSPFITRKGVSSDVTMDWFMWQAKLNRVWRIDVTSDSFTVNSKQLVLPRIVMFYDTSTYENALVHYLRFRSLGFKVVLANAIDIYSKPWNQPGSVLSEANVFVMPGGALHFWSFPYGKRRAWGIGNITQFLRNGGGYVGVCAGATETLQGSPYHYLDIVNASYRHEWFQYASELEADWDWRTLIGPVYIKVEQPTHPVMFGYGSSAVRPGYGPETTIYYYGGPAMHTIGSNATVLARYAGPVTQKDTPKVNDLWGSASIVAADYYQGKVVVFGPHPEWPGPGARLYAQALYHVANIAKPSRLEPKTFSSMSEADISERVTAIRATVGQIKPLLEETTRVAAKIVNLRVGDHYHPLGLWYDESVLSFAKELYSQLNDAQRYTVKFQYEYTKLNALKSMVQNDAQLSNLIDYAQNMISSFFNLTANLPKEPHTIAVTDWTGSGPFEPFDSQHEPTSFEMLTHVFEHINNETSKVLYPYALNYSTQFREYESLRIQNQTAYTPQVNQTLCDLYLNMSASWPAGPLYRGMYTFRHTLDLMQYKVDYHLLNILTLADRTMEILSYVDFALARAVGSFNYAFAEIQAFLAHPEGAFI